MGWETHGVCVKSDGGQQGEVHHNVTSKRKIMLLDYFQTFSTPVCPPTLSTFTLIYFFIYLLHMSVGIVELKDINPALSIACSLIYFVLISVSPLLPFQAQRCRCHGRKKLTWLCWRMTVAWSLPCSTPRPGPSTSKTFWPGWRNDWPWVRH